MNYTNQKHAGCRKKYRIKSKFRFITSIVIMMAILIGGIGALVGLQESVALTKSEPIQVVVADGDTLWDLANTYKSSDTDVRKAVYQICRTNDIKADDLEPGMELIIPESL